MTPPSRILGLVPPWTPSPGEGEAKPFRATEEGGSGRRRGDGDSDGSSGGGIRRWSGVIGLCRRRGYRSGCEGGRIPAQALA
ncbi:unnamed protein product, partial [Ascophyllum nodosum]